MSQKDNLRKSQRLEKRQQRKIVPGESSCRICQNPDNDAMVQCDKCDTWHHFVCVGVSAEVENEDWICANCEPNGLQTPSRPEPSKNLTVRSKRTQLELQRLEEARNLKAKRDEEYLEQKYRILTIDSDEPDSAHDKVSQLRTEQWVRQEVVLKRKSDVKQNHQDDPGMTSYQCAARNSMPKELPYFNGNPEEWPLFISSYESSTKMCGFRNEENLLRLQKSLKGQALEAVRSRLTLPSNVPGIISMLRLLFGRPELILKNILQRVREKPSPREDKLESMISFALVVQNLYATMEACALHAHIANPMLLQELVDKLPPQIKLSWAAHIQDLHSVDLQTFDSWLLSLAETISKVTPTTSYIPDVKNDKRKKEKGYVHTHVEEVNRKSLTCHRKCLICNLTCSAVENCKKFLNMDYKQRWDIVKRERLCRTCLRSHIRSRCQITKVCGKSGCTFRHHHLLHKIFNHSTGESPTTVVSGGQFNCQTSGAATSIKYRVVPVILYGNKTRVTTFAFLDDGSSLTMMEDSLASELRLEGKPQPLHLKWTGETYRDEINSQVVSMQISGIHQASKKFCVPVVRTVKSLGLPKQSLDMEMLAKQHPYLARYPIESYEQANPRLLIGLDNLKLAIPLKTIEGGAGQPVATKTRLGWVAYGPTSESGQSSPRLQFQGFHKCDCENADRDLHNLMREYFSLDSLGVIKQQLLKSSDQERADRIMETQTIKYGNRFEIGLLWKYDNVKLPNSLPMALRRYECLRKKLSRDPVLGENLKQQFKDYLKKGYIRKLTEEEMQRRSPRTWYLPIFAVTNANKPGKIRIVWDAAAEVNNISLNSMLMKGPDHLVSLPSILYRFQERHVAVCADIREMFHQVGVKSEDQHAQRFLWSQELSSAPDVYVMQVLTFGATCSPSCAQFVKNKNAQDFADKYPRAATAIIKNHYVDDLLDSVDTEEEAIQLAQDVRYIHQCGGFEIRNWLSNSQKVIQALGERLSDAKIDLNISPGDTTEKVLGMWWCISSDSFTYQLSPKASVSELLSGGIRPTKRQVLRVLMTVFDPLGLIAHFLIYIKILMQEIWRSKLGWDEPINDGLYGKWCIWVKHLHNISKVRIPRCYFKNIRFGDHDSSQLHMFVDASINAFAAVAYIRATKGNHVECRIIAAKTRVAPLTLTSIPRLELEAARLGVRLANSIKQSHTITFENEIYWTDSKTVLSWIQSDHRNYRQFVGFRISEILETTAMHQWRYVPTKLNVADDATKWNRAPEFNPNNRWFVGPEFLFHPEDDWPLKLKDSPPTKEELKSSFLFHHPIADTALIQPERFSNWKRLVRTQAYVLRFIWNADARRKGVSKRLNNYFDKDEYLAAENYLYRQAQNDSFRGDIITIQNNCNLAPGERKPLNKTSQIKKLSPYLDHHDVLRIRGRIDAAPGVSSNLKRPVLLPKNHYITRLIIKSFHERFHHQNYETAVNEIRQKFYIPNLRVTVKAERNRCQYCKNQQVMPKPPEMGDLPLARLSSFSRPFTYIGIDYFGPLYVVIGRRSEKRWGVIITCMSCRAIHLEIANSLSSDSCILAIKRFICRRGIPREIRCDNGTNFHGAERELREELAKQQPSILADEFSTSMTKWIYNPPASPHMGGSWERLVRSVKRTLYQILPTRNPSDELLYSMLVEVERVINSRPLTYIALEDQEDEVLTPNHLILGTSSGEKPDSMLTEETTLLRRNWMKSQQYANAFWKRWIREYLPTLTRRTKWFEKVKPIAVGDIVVVVDETFPRNVWPKGRILAVSCGKDGQVRKATVQTSLGVYERPAAKLAVLDVLSGKSNAGG